MRADTKKAFLHVIEMVIGCFFVAYGSFRGAIIIMAYLSEKTIYLANTISIIALTAIGIWCMVHGLFSVMNITYPKSHKQHDEVKHA